MIAIITIKVTINPPENRQPRKKKIIARIAMLEMLKPIISPNRSAISRPSFLKHKLHPNPGSVNTRMAVAARSKCSEKG
jgi:hypothetical protein